VSPGSLFSEAQDVAAGLRRFARIFPLARPADLRLEGIIAARQQQLRRAKSRLQLSARVAERLGMPLALGHANLSMGRELNLPDRDRAFYLQEALTIFERTGTPHWAADARLYMTSMGGAKGSPV
jgi:hypothetical protein